ncbi:MAG: S-layer homology domain-containing protein, partial [Clostridia bacterium]|nr:S-layer homology domain-containing protein [Clostridia bacterium]
SAAYSNGIISGMSADSFMPDSFITRQDACLIIYRIIKDSLISGGELPFVDNPDIAVYARDAVAALCNGEIVSGVGDGRFAPTANIDRQSAAVLINNCLKIN